MKLIIGCPIYKRDWIIPVWVAAIERQSFPLNDIGFVFVASESDTKTISMLNKWKNLHTEIPLFDIVIKDDVPHHEHSQNSRQWTMSKYHHMISLRNCLLEKVRKHNSDFFFSLDSDVILQNSSTIELLISHIKDGADAVSPLMFMTPFGMEYPSVMSWIDEPGKKAQRAKNYPIGTYFKSDIIMAAKMMSKQVLQNVDYVFHSQGEDLGWSADAYYKGYGNLFSASYIYAPHIMHKEMLMSYLNNGDARQIQLLANPLKI